MAGVVRQVNGIVAVILFLIGALYCSTVFFVIVPWMGSSMLATANLVGLSYTTFMALYLYLMCVLVDPGKVPDEWVPDEESNLRILPVKKKSGRHRFCQKCQGYKPPRCHHCRVCRRCVLRMDHHCHWMNNCIGHGNYRSFISFLIFLLLALMCNIFLMALHRHHLKSTLKNVEEGSAQQSSLIMDTWFVPVQTAILVGCCFAWMTLFGLFLWNLSLIASNKTTIEYHEGIHSNTSSSVNGASSRHPYDLGLVENYRSIFGREGWKWLLPFAALEGDGIHHNAVIENHQE